MRRRSSSVLSAIPAASVLILLALPLRPHAGRVIDGVLQRHQPHSYEFFRLDGRYREADLLQQFAAPGTDHDDFVD